MGYVVIRERNANVEAKSDRLLLICRVFRLLRESKALDRSESGCGDRKAYRGTPYIGEFGSFWESKRGAYRGIRMATATPLIGEFGRVGHLAPDRHEYSPRGRRVPLDGAAAALHSHP
jgi:hypothetical protein